MARYIVKPTKQRIADTIQAARQAGRAALNALRTDDLEVAFVQADAMIEKAGEIQKLLAERQTAIREIETRPLRLKEEKVKELQNRLDAAQANLNAAKDELARERNDRASEAIASVKADE